MRAKVSLAAGAEPARPLFSDSWGLAVRRVWGLGNGAIKMEKIPSLPAGAHSQVVVVGGNSLSAAKYTGPGRKRRDPPGFHREAGSGGWAGALLLQTAGSASPLPPCLSQPSLPFCSSQRRLGALCWEPSADGPPTPVSDHNDPVSPTLRGHLLKGTPATAKECAGRDTRSVAGLGLGFYK